MSSDENEDDSVSKDDDDDDDEKEKKKKKSNKKHQKKEKKKSRRNSQDSTSMHSAEGYDAVASTMTSGFRNGHYTTDVVKCVKLRVCLAPFILGRHKDDNSPFNSSTHMTRKVMDDQTTVAQWLRDCVAQSLDWMLPLARRHSDFRTVFTSTATAVPKHRRLLLVFGPGMELLLLFGSGKMDPLPAKHEHNVVLPRLGVALTNPWQADQSNNNLKDYLKLSQEELMLQYGVLCSSDTLQDQVYYDMMRNHGNQCLYSIVTTVETPMEYIHQVQQSNVKVFQLHSASTVEYVGHFHSSTPPLAQPPPPPLLQDSTNNKKEEPDKNKPKTKKRKKPEPNKDTDNKGKDTSNDKPPPLKKAKPAPPTKPQPPKTTTAPQQSKPKPPPPPAAPPVAAAPVARAATKNDKKELAAKAVHTHQKVHKVVDGDKKMPAKTSTNILKTATTTTMATTANKKTKPPPTVTPKNNTDNMKDNQPAQPQPTAAATKPKKKKKTTNDKNTNITKTSTTTTNETAKTPSAEAPTDATTTTSAPPGTKKKAKKKKPKEDKTEEDGDDKNMIKKSAPTKSKPVTAAASSASSPSTNLTAVKKKKSSIPAAEKQNAKWELEYQKLVQYKLEHGNTDVPRKYPNDQTFSNWIRMQRDKFNYPKRGALPQERIDKLNALQFDWKVPKTKASPSKTKNDGDSDTPQKAPMKRKASIDTNNDDDKHNDTANNDNKSNAKEPEKKKRKKKKSVSSSETQQVSKTAAAVSASFEAIYDKKIPPEKLAKLGSQELQYLKTELNKTDDDDDNNDNAAAPSGTKKKRSKKKKTPEKGSNDNHDDKVHTGATSSTENPSMITTKPRSDSILSKEERKRRQTEPKWEDVKEAKQIPEEQWQTKHYHAMCKYKKLDGDPKLAKTLASLKEQWEERKSRSSPQHSPLMDDE